MNHIRQRIEQWIGRRPKVTFKHFLTKLVLRTESTDEHTSQLRIKIEINTRDLCSYDEPIELPFKMENSWFTGETKIPTYSREEMIATKLRAMLQRNKGRDLYDIDHALNVFDDLDIDHIIVLFGKYLSASENSISRAEAQSRMFQKFNDSPLLDDMHPLLPLKQSKRLTKNAAEQAFWKVFDTIICILPGDDWVRLDEFLELRSPHIIKS